MESHLYSEWVQLSEHGLNYHKNKFREPYRSPVKLIDWLEEMGLFKNENQKILDAGCGCGANIYYLKKRFPGISATGIDINSELIEKGNLFFERRKIKDCDLIADDLFELKNASIGKYNGVISFQTFSWLPEYRRPLEEIIKLCPSWIALSSLFFKGPISCKIEVECLNEKLKNGENRKYFYNIYSIEEVKQFLEENGYRQFKYTPFEIDIDLKKQFEEGLSIYTETLKDDRRIQIAGPLLLTEYFICAIKS